MGAKQTGDISYCVESIFTLTKIVESEEIWMSAGVEYNPQIGKKSHYISFSRDITRQLTRNIKRWNCGIILDGDKLSNIYHIEPYSYDQISFQYQNGFAVKTLRAYDNNTYNVSLVDHPTHEISKETFELLKSKIESMPKEQKIACKLEHSGEGKVYRGGRKLKETYNFNRKQGGLRINKHNFTSDEVQHLLHHSALNETEERIWTENPINIKGCIKGLVLSQKDLNLLKQSENDLYQDLDFATIKATGRNDYTIVTP